LEIAKGGIERAAKQLKPVARAINIMDGEITIDAVAKTFSLPCKRRFDI
jgi:hypothetical protein